jgi:hypothetical protein
MHKSLSLLLLIFFPYYTSIAQSDISAKLRKLEDVLKKENSAFCDALLPPIKLEALESLNHFYGKKINPAKYELLAALFGWHNGTDEAIYIIPSIYFHSYEVMLRLATERDDIYEFKRRGLFPLFWSNGSEVLCINLCDDSPLIIEADNQVGLQFHEAFNSLGSWIEFNIEAYESGVYFWQEIDGKRYLNCSSFEAYKKLRKPFEPLNIHWYR